MTVLIGLTALILTPIMLIGSIVQSFKRDKYWELCWVVFAISFAALLFCSDSLGEAIKTGKIGEENTQSYEQQTTNKAVIYEDNILKATSLGITENFGYWMVIVELENKSGGEINVLPMDSSIDENMAMFTSGTLATIRSGKVFRQSWLLNTEPREQIEFSMSICDEHMSEIERTGIITIKK